MRELSFPYIEFSWILVLLIPLYFIRVNKWLNPLIIYSWCLSVFIIENPYRRLDFPIRVLVAGENQALFFMVLLLVFVTVMKVGIPTSRIEKFLAWFGAVNICLTVALTPVNHPFVSGLVFNKSMNAVLNLMLLPFVMAELKSVALLFFCVATVFYSESSSALLALTLMTCYFFRKNKLLILLFAVACVLLRCVVMHRPINYLDRIDGWLFFFKTFTTRDWIIGRGPGAFYSYSVYEQVKSAFKVTSDLKVGSGLYMWLHNDYLQALYEYGATGILCLVPAAVWLAKHTKSTAFYSLLALVSGSLFYYPLHWPIHLVVVFCLLKIADNNYKLGHGKNRTLDPSSNKIFR